MIYLVHFILDTENQRADHENSENDAEFTSSFDDEAMLRECQKPNRFSEVKAPNQSSNDDEFIF